MKTVVLDRGAVAAALCASSSERTRYAFDHVRVINGGRNELVSTDGKSLIRVLLPGTDPEATKASFAKGIESDDSGEAMVPIVLLENAVLSSAKSGARQDGKFLLDTAETTDGEGTSVEVRYVPRIGTGIVAKLSAIVAHEQPFPEYGLLFEKDWESGRQLTFKVESLEKALKAAKALKAEHLMFSLASNSECWDKADWRKYIGAVKIRFSGGGHDDADAGVIDMLVMTCT